MALLKTAGVKVGCALVSVRRWAHTVAQPPPLGTAITHMVSPTSPPLVFPENIDDNVKSGAVELPDLPFFAGSIELMAVPKKKVSRHKRGIRNGPKALKPVPVIVRCNYPQRNMRDQWYEKSKSDSLKLQMPDFQDS